MTIEALRRLASKCLEQKANDPLHARPAFVKSVRDAPQLLDALAGEFLQRHAARPKGEIEVRAHQVAPHRRRTQAQKNAAKFAMAMTLGIYKTRKIGDRLLGSIAMGEVRHMVQERIIESAFYMQAGLGELANSLLLHKICKHAQVVDIRSLVSEVIPENVLERFDREAAREATALMPKLMEEHAKNAIRQIESASV